MKNNERYVSDGTEIETPSLCGTCRHKHLNRATCRAFTGGIPDKFLSGTAQHTKPERGDNGIQFEPLDDSS